MTNEQIFKSILPQENFMTTAIIEYIKNKQYVCELARCSFLDGTIYGVTVVNIETRKHEIDLGKPCQTLQEATDYIASLN